MKNLCDALARQYIHELGSLERLAAYMKQENSNLKTRLAEMVPGNALTWLEHAEKWQDNFLSYDQSLDFLSKELGKQKERLRENIYQHKKHFTREIISEQLQLRTNFEKLEELFSVNRNSFNEFLEKSSCYQV